jgi:hypothetical protein
VEYAFVSFLPVVSQRHFEERRAASGDLCMHDELFAMCADIDLEGIRHIKSNFHQQCTNRESFVGCTNLERLAGGTRATKGIG